MMDRMQRAGMAAMAAMVLSFMSLAGTVTLFDIAGAEQPTSYADIRLA